MEIEEQRYGRNKSTAINHTYIESGEYRRKFDNISNDKKLNRLLYQLAKKMLIHRSGTLIEDMYWIDPISIKVVAEEVNQIHESGIEYSNKTQEYIDKNPGLITIHSHPASFPPSISDINSNYYNNYYLGVVVCHDGKVFVYKAFKNVLYKYFEMRVAEYKKEGRSDFDSQMSALVELENNSNGAIKVKEVK